jgi:Tol biopolymer transport system component/DNA-binding winged helix-turn-helix (wHTH) protein
MAKLFKRLLEFGEFRLDASERRLVHGREPVALPPKAFDLLLVLIENSGHLVEKDDLMRRLWPDAFVEEANLAYTVSALRKALEDIGEERRFIETVPKRGYRFIAEVRVVEEAGTVPEPKARPAVETARRWWLVGTAGVLLALWLGWNAFRDAARNSPTEVERYAVPITSYPGGEDYVAFSPDANQIAFVWDGEQEDNPDIYVKTIVSDPPLRLTSHHARDTDPVWCLEGRQIAFLREDADRDAIYLVPPTGGAERRLTEVARAGQTRRRRMNVSPDGKLLAVCTTESGRPRSIVLVSVETGEALRKLTSPPASANGDSNPAFSPDGTSVVFSRLLGARMEDLYLVPLVGGEPHRLTWDTTPVFGAAWTDDGREIVFAARVSGVSNLWRIPASGGARTPITAGIVVRNPTLSPRGGRLAYTKSIYDSNIWRLELSADGSARDPTQWIAPSTFPDSDAEYSPDGTRIAFTSGRSGNNEIWVCDSNGHNPLQLTHFGSIGCQLPHWSPDGRWIVFEALTDGTMDLWSVSAEGGKPKRLTTEPSEEIVPRWSRDGRWIYFGSNRSGSLQIWKMGAEGGAPIQVTRGGGVEARESLDGRFLYYYRAREVAGLWRVPVGGGREEAVLDRPDVGPTRQWLVTEEGIYFVTAAKPSGATLQLFSFTAGKVHAVANLPKPISSLSASRDGRVLLLTQVDQSGSDLMLVENFR